MCDHTIGYLNKFVTVSEIAQTLKDEALGWNSHNKTLNSLIRGNDNLLKEDYQPKDFLDRRRGYMTMFNNCPYCGEKINWREIKKAIKVMA